MMDFLKSKFEGYRWDLVQFKRVRSVYALSIHGVPEFYIKIYHPDSMFQKLRNLIHPKTLREMHTLEKLRTAGVLVPEVADHIRKGTVSALVTRAVYPATALAQLPEEKQMRIMLHMAAILISKGFFYKDCHAGNIILNGSNEPVLVDAYAAVPVGKITEMHVVGLLSQITSAYRVPDATLESFLGEQLPSANPHKVVRKIQKQGMLRLRRQAARRVRRSLREGSFSEEIRTENYHAFMSREHPIDLENVVLEHARNLTDRVHLLKFQHKTQLSAIGDLCVKSYAEPKPFTAPYALRSWKGLLTLFFNRIPVADPVAVVMGKDRVSILITGFVPGRDLNQVLFHEYPSMAIGEKMQTARELGTLLGTLHGHCIYHADLKAANIRVLKDPLRFVLLDTDRVYQGRSIPRKKRIRNLVQINTSIPRHVSRSVRMAFIHAYAAMSGDNPRTLFRDVWRLSSREPICYRTDHGDLIEPW